MNFPISKPLTRRAFLKWSGAAALWAATPALLRGNFGPLDKVSLFHTTDLHGNILPTSTYDGVADVGGLARCATRIRQWKALQPNHLLVDLGDLYQGTDLGYRTEGLVMTDALNHMGYDAWVAGNHEFDWGVDKLHQAIKQSEMPVLAGNSYLGGKAVWAEENYGELPLLPYFIKNVGGYKIAFIGLTTPNMENWFLPELLGDFAAADPVPVLRQTIDRLQAEKPDALILGTHMGIRPWTTEDDAANRLFALTEACPEIDMIVAGHTHRDMPHSRINGIPYSQANYFGIHVGRVDLVFDRESRRLIDAQPMTSYMDASVPPDPAIVSLSLDEIEASQAYMATEIGILADELSIQNAPGRPSDVEMLIGASFMEGLSEKGHPVDAVVHGLLFMDDPVSAGTKTVEDMWGIIPFENFVVTATLTVEELKGILQEVYQQRTIRSLMGLEAEVEGRGDNLQVLTLRDQNGQPLDRETKLRVAFNSYDAAGGGARFPRLRAKLREESAAMKLHRYQSRAMLIDFFTQRETVSRSDLG
ncbi:MAG: bifunctional metallophosphatase/5'-nucleotidase [Opitutales bacterium]|nr:bifunctional metallophosphatase/5'-nucleotidase [Opitutales bacterium]MCH8540203.1 bifunctional metallophosphatase/5'-nucleotidase [Opitutales bacterium]